MDVVADKKTSVPLILLQGLNERVHAGEIEMRGVGSSISRRLGG